MRRSRSKTAVPARAAAKRPDKRRESGRRVRPAWRDRGEASDGPVILYGWHTVAAALANPQRTIRKLFCPKTPPGGSPTRISTPA